MLFLRHPVHHHHSVNLVLNYKQEQPISTHSFVRVLVVDDFAPWQRFVVPKLRENHNLRVVAVASDGLEAVLKSEELQPTSFCWTLGYQQ
jgi:PleD family two-component response regulator